MKVFIIYSFNFIYFLLLRKKIVFLCSLLRTIYKDFKNKRKFIKIKIHEKKKKIAALKET